MPYVRPTKPTASPEQGFIDGVRTVLARDLHKSIIMGDAVVLTISSGEVTVTQSYHQIDTEGGAGSDDLDTINGGADGMLLICRSVAAARIPTFKDGTGNLILAGDFTMDTARDMITLVYDAGATKWYEISRSNNA